MTKQRYEERDIEEKEPESSPPLVHSKPTYESGSELQFLLSDVTSMLEKIEPLVTGTYHPTIAAIEERDKLRRSAQVLLELTTDTFETAADENVLKAELEQLKSEIVLLDQERVKQYTRAESASPLSMPGNFVVVPPHWGEGAKE